MAIKELFNDARPQVLFDPRASQRIDPRFKFTRNGPASYYDSQGILRYAPANQPRVGFNYEPDGNGVMLPVQGVLLEAAGTNLLTYSEQFDNAAWTKLYLSVSANSVAAPDGTTTADTLIPSTNNESHTAYATVSVSNTEHSHFVYAKAAGYRYLQLDMSATYGTACYANFDLQDGVVGSKGSTVLSSGIEKLPNGWYKCYLTAGLPPGGAANAFVHVAVVNSLTAGRLPAFAGDGTSGIYVWGAQLETGSLPTSYIPTSGSTVTRSADLLTIESPLPATGSIYIDARSLTSDVDTTLLSAAPASPSTDKLALAIREPANLYNSKALVYEVDGAFKPTLPFPVPTNARERNLITYGANNYHYRSDSARYTPSSSTSVPANMTRLGIGHDVTDPTKGFNGYINAVYLWPGEITPTVAEALVRGDVDPKDADAGVFTPAAGSLAFVFNTQGTATDGNTVVQLPLRGSTNNVLVDWGDNTSSSLIGAAASVTVNHTYSSAGIYPVQIEADDDGTNSGLAQLQFYGNSPADLVRVLQWGGTTTFQPTTMYQAFRGCTQMDFESDARNNLPDTNSVANWRLSFFGCSSITGSFPDFDLSGATDIRQAWQGCSSVTSFANLLDTLNSAGNYVTDYQAAWRECSSIVSFPTITIPSDQGAVSLYQAWYGCSSLESFPTAIDTSAVTIFADAWLACSSLEAMTTINVSNGTNFNRAWQGCASLTTFTLTNFVSATNLGSAFYGWTSFTGTFPALTTSNALTQIDYAWRNNLMTGFNLPTNTSQVTNMRAAWENCSGLTVFPSGLDSSSCTIFDSTWAGCANLTSFPFIDVSAGENFSRAWQSCNALSTFPALDFSSATGLASDASNIYTGFRLAWNSCDNLANWPASTANGGSQPIFDNTACTRFLDAFKDCALTAQSIENILVSINTAGTSNGNLGIGGGTNAAKTTWSAAANTAYDALIARGWTITYNA